MKKVQQIQLYENENELSFEFNAIERRSKRGYGESQKINIMKMMIKKLKYEHFAGILYTNYYATEDFNDLSNDFVNKMHEINYK